MTLDLDALETSFDLVAPRGDELMDEFYARLFAAAPAVKPLFPDDMRQAEDACCSARSCCCASRCATSTRSCPKLRELGARHVAYGAGPSTTPWWARP